MFKRCLWFLFLGGMALSQTPTRKIAMVLNVQGTTEVLTGQLWSVGERIDMPEGAKVTVLLLNQGQRLELTGKGSVKVAPDGLKLEGTHSTRLASTRTRLALNGENQRQIGGMVTRTDVNKAAWNSLLDRVEISAQGVTLSRPAGSGSPPQLQFFYLDPQDMPTLGEDFRELAASVPPSKSVLSTEVAGQKVGSRWQWQAAWPPGQASKSYSLRVFELPVKKFQLWTRVYHPAQQELQELAAAREQARQWSAREPRSPEPWIYLATLLEFKGHLEEALLALKSAQRLRPIDRGLKTMQVRLLLDLGRYQQAAQAAL